MVGGVHTNIRSQERTLREQRQRGRMQCSEVQRDHVGDGAVSSDARGQSERTQREARREKREEKRRTVWKIRADVTDVMRRDERESSGRERDDESNGGAGGGGVGDRVGVG